MRSVVLFAGVMLLSACGCDDSAPSMHLTPWGDGQDLGLEIVVGDSLPFVATVTGRAKGYVLFGDQCTLFDSQTDPTRFDIELTDSLVARVVSGARESYVIGVRPGASQLVVEGQGVGVVVMPFTVVP